MTTHTTAKGFTLQTYAAPPPNFDISSVGDSDRAQFGFSAFDDNVDLQERLASTLKGYRFLEPLFEAREIAPLDVQNLSTEAAALPTQSWSGAILSGSTSDPICWVQGSWTVPSIAPPTGAPGGIFYAASPWVGIDGIGSRDILQAGCDAQITPDNAVRYRVWYEWYPEDSNYIPNMPLSPGDVLSVSIKLYPGSNTSAAIIFANQSKGVACNFALTAKPGFALVGNCAEWIVESEPQLGTLANFGIVNFTGCRAGAVSGAMAGVTTATPVLMIDASRNLQSAGEIVGANDVRVRFVRG